MNTRQALSFLMGGPVYVHYGITHRCDVGCRMCGIWRFGREEEELTTSQIEGLASTLRSLGVLHVSLGGGEPFMRRDLPEVVSLFIREGIRVRVLTNGITPDEAGIRAVAGAGLREVSVSFDSLHPKRYSWITRNEDAWDRGVRNLHHFATSLPRRGGILIMNSVVSALNFREIPHLVSFADLMGYHISLLPVELAERGDKSNPFLVFQPGFRIGEGELPALRQVYGKVVEMKRSGYNVLNSTPFLEASARYFTEGAFPRYCDAGRLYFSINPGGMMTLCHKGREYISILDKGFKSFIRSREFKRLMREEIEGCEGCIRPCWMDTSSIFHTPLGFAEAISLYARTALFERRPPPPLSTLLAMKRVDGDSP